MPQIYREPMYAKVLNWKPLKEGSFSEAVLISMVVWGSAAIKTVEALFLKRHSKKQGRR